MPIRLGVQAWRNAGQTTKLVTKSFSKSLLSYASNLIKIDVVYQDNVGVSLKMVSVMHNKYFTTHKYT